MTGLLVSFLLTVITLVIALAVEPSHKVRTGAKWRTHDQLLRDHRTATVLDKRS